MFAECFFHMIADDWMLLPETIFNRFEDNEDVMIMNEE